MGLPPRGALVAAVSSRLRRGLSTATSRQRPEWVMLPGSRPELINSTSHRATLQLAKPPCFSELPVHAHHINPGPRIDSEPERVGVFNGRVSATNGDGLLLLEFRDGPATPAFAAKVGAALENPDITRLVSNPLSGEVSRLPDIDGTNPLAGRHHATTNPAAGQRSLKPQTEMPLRRLLGYFGAASSRLRRGLSTAASPSQQPSWAMVRQPTLVDSPAPRALLHLAAPPCISEILVPAHLVDPPFFGAGLVSAASADGLLLFEFADLRDAVSVVAKCGSDDLARALSALSGFMQDADITRLVCNPLSGEVLRLPDMDGSKKIGSCSDIGILTRSERPDQPPDRYAVAMLEFDNHGGHQRFVMRRFLSQTGKWDKLVALPSPSPHPLGRSMEVVAFAGRLWWVDISCGIVSADPFSDRPDLHFVELPRGRVTEPMEDLELDSYRRVGVSQGRLRYAEVSPDEPFLLSSFTLDDGGTSWTMEQQVAFNRLWAGECHPYHGSPRISVMDPMNASVIHVTIDNHVIAVDMVRKKLLGYSTLDRVRRRNSSFLKACVLPPWLETTRIPSAGTLSRNRNNAKSNTLSDILVRADRDKKN